MQDSFQQTLRGISNRCRNRVGVVIPWEFILAIIAMIREHCPQWESADGFCRSCKQPGPFAKWWLLARVRDMIDVWNAGQKGFGGRVPRTATRPILDELFETCEKTESEQLMRFHRQLTRAGRGEDPDEE